MKATAEDIQKYIELGGNIGILTNAQIATIPQELIIQYVANGGDFFDLTEAQRETIPEEVIEQHSKNGNNSFNFNTIQRQDIPREVISRIVSNECKANEWGLRWILYNSEEFTPQEVINQYVANGGDFTCFTRKQRATIPQEVLINM